MTDRDSDLTGRSLLQDSLRERIQAEVARVAEGYGTTPGELLKGIQELLADPGLSNKIPESEGPEVRYSVPSVPAHILPPGWQAVPVYPSPRMVEGAGSMLPASMTLTEAYRLFREVWAEALERAEEPPVVFAEPEAPALARRLWDALEAAAEWHEEEADNLSKQPPGGGDREWRLHEHREQARRLRAAATGGK